MEATSWSDACRPVQLDVFVGSALRSGPELAQLVELVPLPVSVSTQP